MLTRIICKDGLTYVGEYDTRRSNTFKVYLVGHTSPIWRRTIDEMFELTNRWRRVMGNVSSVYDSYLETGGCLWPNEFYTILYTNDI